LIRGSLEAGAPPESLSVFASIHDPDGSEDIEALYLACDEASLVWKFDKDTWIEKEQEGSTWIGSNAIAMPDGSALPRAAYRLMVVDAAGERDERLFRLAEPPSDVKVTAQLRDGNLLVDLPFSAGQAVFQDAAGATLLSLPIGEGSQALSSLMNSQPLASAAKYLVIMSIDESRNIGAVSARLSLP
jgi:hypothetical protein